MKNNKGLMGVSLLLLFISILVLVATAVSVLLYVGAGYQQKAYITENDVEEGIITGLDMILINAMDASENDRTPGTIENFDLTVKLRAGSDPVGLNRTTIVLDHEIGTYKWHYGGDIEQDGTGNSTHFFAYYMSRGPFSMDGHVSRGDVVRLKFNITDTIDSHITARNRLRFTILHRVGVTNHLDVVTPEAMADVRVTLYPPTIH